MRLCIPVSAPEGLESLVEPDLHRAEYLLFFDTETRLCDAISLREEQAGTAARIQIDAVLCTTINRVTLHALSEQGVMVYGTDARTVAQAIAHYEDGGLTVAVAQAGGCGCDGHAPGHTPGGCGGGHAHGKSGRHDGAGAHQCGAGGAACGGEGQGCGEGHNSGACCANPGPRQRAIAPRSRSDEFRIAVSSQNRKTVTEHAGKCRKFWIFDVRQGQVIGKTLLELPIEQSLHAAPAGEAHPLDSVNVLITSGMGSGLQQRLLQRGVEAVLTTEEDPERAVAAYLASEFQVQPGTQKRC